MLYKALDFSQAPEPLRGREDHKLVLALATMLQTEMGDVVGTMVQKESNRANFMSHFILNMAYFLTKRRSLNYRIGL